VGTATFKAIARWDFERVSDAFLDRLGETFGFSRRESTVPTPVAAIRAMLDGKRWCSLRWEETFSPPRPIRKRPRRRSAAVAHGHVSTKLHGGTGHGGTGLILPCLGRTERDGDQFVSVEDAMGIVHAVARHLEPASAELKSEVENRLRTRERALPDSRRSVACTRARLRRHSESDREVIPGFEEYNARVRRGGFSLPNARAKGVFQTSSSRAHFFAHPLTGGSSHPISSS